MSQESRYYRVGLFVLVGVALLVGAILVIGGTDLLRKPIVVETYFDESVQGLEIGSPVKYRGVEIGGVSYIGLVDDVYEFESDEDRISFGQMVIVRMKLTPQGDDPVDDPIYRQERTENLRRMIERGLRVRLAQQGVTGTAYIEADYVSPDANPPMHITWKPAIDYLPSAPSTLKSISNAAERIFTRLDALPVEDILVHLDELLVGMHDAVDRVDVVRLQEQASALFEELEAAAASLRGLTDNSETRLVAGDLRAVLAELETTLAAVRGAVDEGGPVLGELLDNLRAASRDLRDVAETARSYPSVLLLGEAPPRVSTEVTK
jgi:phospholipid/cholesterol/gamma-HCH transport system substrate-binding protein/paraquat-inducible protein B